MHARLRPAVEHRQDGQRGGEPGQRVGVAGAQDQAAGGRPAGVVGAGHLEQHELEGVAAEQVERRRAGEFPGRLGEGGLAAHRSLEPAQAVHHVRAALEDVVPVDLREPGDLGEPGGLEAQVRVDVHPAPRVGQFDAGTRLQFAFHADAAPDRAAGLPVRAAHGQQVVGGPGRGEPVHRADVGRQPSRVAQGGAQMAREQTGQARLHARRDDRGAGEGARPGQRLQEGFVTARVDVVGAGRRRGPGHPVEDLVGGARAVEDGPRAAAEGRQRPAVVQVHLGRLAAQPGLGQQGLGPLSVAPAEPYDGVRHAVGDDSYGGLADGTVGADHRDRGVLYSLTRPPRRAGRSPRR